MDEPSSSSRGGGLASIPAWAWALIFAVVLCLPRLGSFGFWDPSELKIADQARDMARSGSLFDTTVAGKYPQSAPLGLFLSALGIKLFGPSEFSARIFIALAAMGAMLGVYWAGVGLFRKRAALLGVLALGTMTMFVLEARQLTSDVPIMAGLALSMAGLARWAWPASGRRRLSDLAVGVLGLVIGHLGGGALAGVVLPLLSLVAAVLVGRGLTPTADAAAIDDGTAELAAVGVGEDIPAARPFGASLLSPAAGRAFFVIVAFALGGAALLAASMTGMVAGHYSGFIGGVPRAGAPAHTFEALVRELGFGLFPWSAVAVFALARPLARLDDDGEAGGARTNARLAFGQLYLLLFAGLGFALSSYRLVILGEARALCLPAIALAIGAFLDEALDGRRAEPVGGLLMATGTMIVARDFFLAPEELVSVNLYEKVKWPSVISIEHLILAIGFFAAAGVYAGLAARGRALGYVAAPAPEGEGPRRRRLDRLAVGAGRWGLQASVAIAVIYALWLAQGLVPALSTHFSFKPALESYAKFAKPGDKIARYHVEGHGQGFYGSGDIVDVPSQDALIDTLRGSARAFALVSSDDLASLDAGFKRAGLGYYVLDAASSRFLLLSNQLAAGETDVNPLKKNVWMAPTVPTASSGWNDAEKPPWSWRIPVSATFGDSIELVGASFPETVRRPGKIPLDLTFRIKTPPPSGYKIFVHFDGPAAPRVIGDHDPVEHAFPTAFWLPGEYIRDHYETEVPLMTTPAGTYTVLVGFWPGGEGRRLKVTQGPNDGADRVRLGTLEIK
ncbi:MAG TPA: glycosyltransferase family 39 protein [Polyangia bacterium]|nr:glycosyltransferase family 39 protein [Polyangia bacterium]